MRQIGVRARARRLLGVVGLTGTLLVVGVAPTLAAAPPPPPDACLSLGSFNIAGSECNAYDPERGNQFGPIAGIEIMAVERGARTTLSAPNGGTIDFGPPVGRNCGENGCPRNAISWRRGLSFHQGVGFVAGCNATDITCTVVHTPPLIGDAGEVYQVVYAEQYLGITPTGNSRMFALYTPPTVYPVRLDPVDSSGARVALPAGYTAYAVREGTNPTQADCDTTPWVEAALVSATFPIPDCTTFSRRGFLSGGDNWFEGVLPNDSGTWIVVGAPAGDASAPLLSRPSPYRRMTLTPRNDDLVGTIVAERRPGLSMEVRPETTVMDIGTRQVVDVIVSAEGGETGVLEGLAFEDAGIVALTESPDAALEIVSVSEAVPATGFSLGVGEQRVFHVEVLAVGLGEGAIGVAVSGRDDLGQPLRVEQGGPILVEYAEGSEGADAPAAPTVTRALDTGAASPDVIEGTVEGAPETTLTVSLASSASGADGTCTQLMTGDGVAALGSFPVTIGIDGTGSFTREGELTPGWSVYGIASEGPSVSEVGECMPVSEVTPSLSIEDAQTAEGNGKKTTPLSFTVSLSSPAEQTVTVEVVVADGTATAPDDYVAPDRKTLSFAPGEVSTEFLVEVVRDATEEPDEVLTATLSNPVGGAIVAGSATGTVLDDDGKGGAVDSADLRGTWQIDLIPPVQGGRVSLEIRTQRANGTLSGVLTTVYKGDTTTQKMTGPIKGDRLALDYSTSGRVNATTKGSLVVRDGTLMATMTGKDSAGDKVKYKMTLIRPKGD